MNQHKTKKMKFQERREYFRNKAKYIIEVEPRPEYFIFIGQLCQALNEQCVLNDELQRKVDNVILDVLKTWANFTLYINLFSEIAREVGKATNQKVYIDSTKFEAQEYMTI